MNITTVKELKKYIGEFLAFEYTSENERIVWIQKLHSIDDLEYANTRIKKICRNSEIDKLHTYGLYTTEVYPRQRIYTKFPEFPYSTNAQNIIRTPTYEEMKIFQNMWRRYRILKDETILNKKIL